MDLKSVKYVVDGGNFNLKTNNMKNIHILPTDKSSRLYYFTGNKPGFYLYPKNQLLTPVNPNYINQNFYITSDEEIKEGDYYITPNNTVLKALGPMLINVEDYKKIILTTDFRLAPDVQKIDNEFLEWFVNNPNCESVKIDQEKVLWKIIIPKEEPKLTNVCIKCGVDLYYTPNFICQEHPKNCKGIHLSEETLKERVLKEEPDYTALLQPVGTKQEIKLEDIFNDDKKENIKKFIDEIKNPSEPNQALKDAAQRYEKYSERFDNDKSAIGNPQTWGKRLICKDCNEPLEDCTCILDTVEFPKQKTTIEEVAEKLKGRELFKESNDRARKTLSEIKSLPIQETLEDKLKELVLEWQKRQEKYYDIAYENVDNVHTNRKFTYKAMATRDCWKELLKLIEK